MSRDDGFQIADVDTGYLEDAKMRDLWQRLHDPDRMARAVCIHTAVMLASWRSGDRVTAAQACPLWLAADAALLRDLRAVKLLDRTSRIPLDSFVVWFGTAFSRRANRREIGRLGGLAKAANTSPQARNGPADATATAEHDHSASLPVRPSVPTVPSGRPDTARDEEGRPDLDAFFAVRYRPPTPAQRLLMDAYCHVFDETGPERAAQLIFRHPDDPIGALKADLAEFRDERKEAALAEERPKPKRRDKGTGMTSLNQELAALLPSMTVAAADGSTASLKERLGEWAEVVGGKTQ